MLSQKCPHHHNLFLYTTYTLYLQFLNAALIQYWPYNKINGTPTSLRLTSSASIAIVAKQFGSCLFHARRSSGWCCGSSQMIVECSRCLKSNILTDPSAPATDFQHSSTSFSNCHRQPVMLMFIMLDAANSTVYSHCFSILKRLNHLILHTVNTDYIPVARIYQLHILQDSPRPISNLYIIQDILAH